MEPPPVWIRTGSRRVSTCIPDLSPCRKDLCSINQAVPGQEKSTRLTRRLRCDDAHRLPLAAIIAGSVLATSPLSSVAKLALNLELASSGIESIAAR